MKAPERSKAIALRKKGYSMKEIARRVGVSKGSVSLWVREIKLEPSQLQNLKNQQHTRLVVEKRRQTRLKNSLMRRATAINAAKREIVNLSKNDLFILGVGLYWGEGTKRNKGTLQFTNSDPRMIEVMTRFFRETMNIPHEKFRGHITLHYHLSVSSALKYWSEVTQIPQKQFYKTTVQKNRVRKSRTDVLQHGTMSIEVSDTKLFLKMLGWIEGVYHTAVQHSKRTLRN